MSTKGHDHNVWYVCKLCSRAFERRKHLVRHKREIHGTNLKTENDKIQQSKNEGKDSHSEREKKEESSALIIDDAEKQKPSTEHSRPSRSALTPKTVVSENGEENKNESETLCDDNTKDPDTESNSASSSLQENRDVDREEVGDEEEEDNDDESDEHLLNTKKQKSTTTPTGDNNKKRRVKRRKLYYSAHGRVYRCKHCGKILASNSSLNGHLKIHTRESKYQCQSCDKTFASKRNQQSHEKTHRDTSSNNANEKVKKSPATKLKTTTAVKSATNRTTKSAARRIK